MLLSHGMAYEGRSSAAKEPRERSAVRLIERRAAAGRSIQPGVDDIHHELPRDGERRPTWPGDAAADARHGRGIGRQKLPHVLVGVADERRRALPS
jgi:hypothetical protein